MPGLILEPAELHGFTGYAQRERQRAWLTEHGVPFRSDAVGRLLVSRRVAEDWLANRPVQNQATGGIRLDKAA